MTAIEATAKTAMSRRALSAPAMHLLKRGLLVGEVLDYGCGKCDLEKFIEACPGAKHFPHKIVSWDPNFHPTRPREKFDTVVCIYVLNVLDPISRKKALLDAQGYVKNNGRLYIAVRRDIKRKTQTYPGVIQYPVKLQDPFVSIFKRSGGFEIYEWSRQK